jgi:hypothetical protein
MTGPHHTRNINICHIWYILGSSFKVDELWGINFEKGTVSLGTIPAFKAWKLCTHLYPFEFFCDPQPKKFTVLNHMQNSNLLIIARTHTQRKRKGIFRQYHPPKTGVFLCFQNSGYKQVWHHFSLPNLTRNICFFNVDSWADTRLSAISYAD